MLPILNFQSSAKHSINSKDWDFHCFQHSILALRHVCTLPRDETWQTNLCQWKEQISVMQWWTLNKSFISNNGSHTGQAKRKAQGVDPFNSSSSLTGEFWLTTMQLFSLPSSFYATCKNVATHQLYLEIEIENIIKNKTSFFYVNHCRGLFNYRRIFTRIFFSQLVVYTSKLEVNATYVWQQLTSRLHKNNW